MPSKLWTLLDPLGPLSPLNPQHFLNPFRRSAGGRRPPAVTLGESHASLLAKLYGKGRLDGVPFPNMEWWWNTIDLEAAGEEFSILTNVHVFAAPVGSAVVQGTLAVRNLGSKRGWQAHTTGVLDPGPACRFTASGWHLYRDRHEDVYRIDVIDNDLEVDLEIAQGEVAYFNDPTNDPGFKGWYDNNPEGAIPYWASYRSRFSSSIEGSIKVPGDRDKRKVTKGSARFDHQSLHWSGKDIGQLTPDVLAEMAITRPRWRWYHATLKLAEKREADEKKPQVLHLMAYELENGHTGALLKQAVALSTDDGLSAGVDSETLSFKPSHQSIAGRVPAPKTMTLEFDTLGGMHWKMRFECRDDQGWTVQYPTFGSACYEAQEVIGDVTGDVKGGGKCYCISGTGTLEVLDMLQSINIRT